MKRKLLKKTVLCFGLALTVIVATPGTNMLATSFMADASLAGISLTLDKYYNAEENKPAVAQIEIERKNVEDTESAVKDTTKDAATPKVTAENTTTVKAVEREKTKEEKAKEEKAKEKAKEAKKKSSKYKNVGISIANDYVNIRKEANTDSEIMGKLYKGSASTILETKGEWVKIKSGSVKGYIKSEYLAIGDDAEKLVDKYATKWATVQTTSLKVRDKRTTKSACLTMIPIGETYEVIKEHEEWVKIIVDEGDEGSEGTSGYVSKDYVTIQAKFQHAISIEEEKAELKRKQEAEEALREQERQEELKRQQEQQKRANSASSSSSSSSSSNSIHKKPSNSSSSSNKRPSSTSNSSSSSSSSSTQSSSGSGSQVAAFAQKFVGNPYVWGGTSLTNGADCSGFVQSVYRNFGVSIPRTSGSQSGTGKSVSVSNLQPGDLVFYAKNGSVNHVAIYIGGGRVCHASNKRVGITTSNLYYRKPHSAKRVIN